MSKLVERPNFPKLVDLASDLYEALRAELDAVGIDEGMDDDDHNDALLQAFNHIEYIIADLKYMDDLT